MLNKSTATELYQQYSSGKRQFSKAQLEKIDFSELSLGQVDLSSADFRQANLNYAKLKNVNFSDSDLRESSLIRADLSKARLTRANLAGVDLSKANLAVAKLIEANLTKACLRKACFTAANLTQANLSDADLSGAYLVGVDLSSVKLTGAIYDSDTNFPPGFDPIKVGMVQELAVEKLLAEFNHLCRCSNRYLGNTITARYFQSSRPDFKWLNQFEIDKSSQITFTGNFADSVSSEQLSWFQKWLEAFSQSCSKILKNFSELV